MSPITQFLRWADRLIFVLLLVVLIVVIFSLSQANLQLDSGDYYSILQQLTDSGKTPVIGSLYFTEERSPGYSIIAVVPYYLASYALEPFVETQHVSEGNASSGQGPARPPGGGDGQQTQPPRSSNGQQAHPADGGDGQQTPGMPAAGGQPTGGAPGQAGIPATRLLARDIFFKNIDTGNSGVFEWKIIFALLLTSFGLLFGGIFFSIKTLALEKRKVAGYCLPPLVIMTSPVFMHNVINTPAYATLAVFGLSSVFCYFFIKSFKDGGLLPELMTGLFLGLLVLTRLEVVIIAAVLGVFLALYRRWAFLRNLILGGLPALAILLAYNLVRFGTPLYFGILRGDINQFGFDGGYMVANLIDPRSGMFFWSFLICAGLLGLFFGGKKHLRALGVASMAMIALLLVRMPVMYECIGGGSLNIGGIDVACPATMEEALDLVRLDVNRYIVVLAPFAILGLQNLISVVAAKFSRKRSAGEAATAASRTV